MSQSHSGADRRALVGRELSLNLEGFAWATLDEEARREGLTIEELVTFSILYYLADIDSGRVARRISDSPYPHTTDTDTDGDAAQGDASQRAARSRT